MGDESGGRENLTTTQITIFNQTYRVTSADGGERAARVARLVDSKMRETAAQITTHDVARIAVLTALQIADELLLLQETEEREARIPAAPDDAAGHNPAGEDGGPSPAAPRGTWFESIFDSEPAPPESRGGRMGSSLSERLRTARQIEIESGAAGDGPEGGSD
jgi:cell division protein ZapA (FtsZ GTPase activity inhibitor)